MLLRHISDTCGARSVATPFEQPSLRRHIADSKDVSKVRTKAKGARSREAPGQRLLHTSNLGSGNGPDP
jgi:hypothetical protein